MKRIYLYYNESYCIRRSLDAQKIYTYLTENNYELVKDPAKADVILFITCASLNSATDFSLKKIKEFQKKYDAELIVGGCLPGINPDELKKNFNGKTLCTKKIDEIQSLLPGKNIRFEQLDDANKTTQFTNNSNLFINIKNIFSKSNKIKNFDTKIREHIIKNIYGKNSRFYRWGVTKNQLFLIRISWGCTANCSYCGIKNAIGPLKSKPVDQCIKEFKKGLKQGYTDFVINADDVGAYGIDINANFAELLDKLTSIPGEYKISILDLSPRWALKYMDELEKIIKKGKIIRIDIPIQSGNPRILKLMKRYSDIKQIKQVFKRFKEAYPSIILDTRLILGFPSETKNDFIDTLDFIKEIDFFSGYIYPFSLKKGTKAEEIEPKISNKEIKKRVSLAKKILTAHKYNFVKVPYRKFYFFEKQN